MTYTNLAVTVALVFAMTGGAYAAGKFLITSTKQISPKVLKQLKGAAGSKGAPGANGTNGAGGPQGPPGINGKDGVNGKDGLAGTSVTSKSVTAGVVCKEGGTEFTAAEGKKTTVCNGSPWTAEGVLPSGASEKGTWGAFFTPSGTGFGSGKASTISFTIPLEKGLPAHIVKVGEKGDGKGCPTTSDAANPEAEPGNLCIFATVALKVESLLVDDVEQGKENETGRTGVVIIIAPSQAGFTVSALGTWAVTA
jgi:Collagen triple helix repeat (20 copies)